MLCSYGIRTIAGAYFNIIPYVHRDMIIILLCRDCSNIRVRRYDKCVSELRRLRLLLLLFSTEAFLQTRREKRC